MSKRKNKEIVLAERPSGVPDKSTFGMNDIDMPEMKDGEVLLKSLYVSVDPGMRGFMDKEINYKKTGDMCQAIKDACPEGVDVFFDNVGGELFDAVFEDINKKARMVICGQIAQYNKSDPPQGPRPQHKLIKKSARIEGFVVFDFKDEFDVARKQLGKWYRSGNLIEGFEQLPSAFIGLFSGENIGKQMVKVGEVE